MDTKQIRKALKTGRLYDFVAEHYYEMSRDQLKELILNLEWVATEGLTDAERERFYAKVEEELDNRDFFTD